MEFMVMSQMIIFIVYILFSVSGIILMRYGGIADNITSFIFFGVKLNFISIAGFMCYGISFMLWTYLVQKFNISKLLPISAGISNTLTIAAAVALLGEKLSSTNGIGIGIVILGIVLINI